LEPIFQGKNAEYSIFSGKILIRQVGMQTEITVPDAKAGLKMNR